MEGNITRSARERLWERRMVSRKVVSIFRRGVRMVGGIMGGCKTQMGRHASWGQWGKTTFSEPPRPRGKYMVEKGGQK